MLFGSKKRRSLKRLTSRPEKIYLKTDLSKSYFLKFNRTGINEYFFKKKPIESHGKYRNVY